MSDKIVKIDEDIVLLDKQYKNVSETMKTVKVKRKTTESQVKCDHCNDNFVNNNSLEIHLNNLSFNKKFKCNECEMVFHTKWRLNKHQKIHQSSTKKRNCHYFNSGQVCPYEDLGCKFFHKYSEECKHGSKCAFHMCQFKHC